MKKLFTILFLSLNSISVTAQDSENFSIDGDFRLSYNNSGQELDLDNGFIGLKSRIGTLYTLSSTHSLRVRFAGTITEEFEPLRFTITADGGGLNFGSFSFDEFYYRYKSTDLDLKLGRFQHSIPALTNAKRSILRFQSNNLSIHWSDGIYLKRNLQKNWSTEFIGEYQPRNHTTYQYRGNLDFGNNKHNVTTYLAVENRTRDDLNIIQKGFGIFFAPNSFNKNGEYTHYAAVTSRIALDFPQKEVLNGGSIRIAGELGQNLNTSFDKGTIVVASFGVNNVADKHEFMVEFAKSDRDWLLANVYGLNTDEVEFRYRFFILDNLNFDARFRIRDFRDPINSTNRNLFIRLTYSL